MDTNGRALCTYCFEEKSNPQGPCTICGYTEGSGAPDTELTPGTLLMGRYAVGRMLGKGGFGVTYLAYDLKREFKVAIKEYMPDSLAYRTPGNTTVTTYQGDKEENFRLGAEKFYEEARTVSRFNGHPHIINVQEFFYENNTAYFVMEYVEGVDLKAYVAQQGGAILQEECLRLLMPVMDALIVVHSVGVLHRDISPDNIYVTKDAGVKLLDFGAARQVLGEKSKSLSVILKPGFAPFEQYQTRGKQGQWTDVYALAATMYYCLTGQIPEAAMDRLYDDKFRNQVELNEGISERLAAALIKALEVKPENRYRTVYEFKQAIVDTEESIESEVVKIDVQKENVPVQVNDSKNMEKAVPAKAGEIAGKKKYFIPVVAVVLILLIGTGVYALLRQGATETDNGPAGGVVAMSTADAAESRQDGENGQVQNTESTSAIAEGTSTAAEASMAGTPQTEPSQSMMEATAAQGIKETQASVSDNDKKGTTKVENIGYQFHRILWDGYESITYTGEWKDGKPNGMGTGVWEYGSRYVGEWKDGYPYNKGSWITKSGMEQKQVNYYGVDLGGQTNMAPDAKSEAELTSGKQVSVAKKAFTYKTVNYSIKGSYFGEWKSGEPNGRGFIILTEDLNKFPHWKKGNYLIGTFKDGIIVGKVSTFGEYPILPIEKVNAIFAAGQTDEPLITADSLGYYEGGFANGLRNGKGTLDFMDYRYEGEWKDGLPVGKGTFYDVSGDKLGTIQWDGDKYEIVNE
jgi:serine/threonine protein kinase